MMTHQRSPEHVEQEEAEQALADLEHTMQVVAAYVLSVILAFLGAILLVGVMLPLMHVPAPTEHLGIIEQKYIQLVDGTETYHLIVNENGTLLDVGVTGLDYNSKFFVGGQYAWETKNHAEVPLWTVPLIVAAAILFSLGITATPVSVVNHVRT